jgi:hypothetical protein
VRPDDASAAPHPSPGIDPGTGRPAHRGGARPAPAGPAPSTPAGGAPYDVAADWPTAADRGEGTLQPPWPLSPDAGAPWWTTGSHRPADAPGGDGAPTEPPVGEARSGDAHRGAAGAPSGAAAGAVPGAEAPDAEGAAPTTGVPRGGTAASRGQDPDGPGPASGAGEAVRDPRGTGAAWPEDSGFGWPGAPGTHRPADTPALFDIEAAEEEPFGGSPPSAPGEPTSRLEAYGVRRPSAEEQDAARPARQARREQAERLLAAREAALERMAERQRRRDEGGGGRRRRRR